MCCWPCPPPPRERSQPMVEGLGRERHPLLLSSRDATHMAPRRSQGCPLCAPRHPPETAWQRPVRPTLQARKAGQVAGPCLQEHKPGAEPVRTQSRGVSAQDPHLLPLILRTPCPRQTYQGGQEPPELGEATALKENHPPNSALSRTLPGENWTPRGQTVIFPLQSESLGASRPTCCLFQPPEREVRKGTELKIKRRPIWVHPNVHLPINYR